MKSPCSRCKTYTNQQVLFEHKVEEEDIITNWFDTDKYQIIQCMGCDTISFRKLHTDTQMDAQAAMGGYLLDDGWSQELFPKITTTLKEFPNTPKSIIKIYRESINAYDNNQFILCAAGLRAIIEGICNNKEIEGTNLFKKIEGLSKEGFLTNENSKTLHELRFLGNSALHSLASPSMAELTLAKDILEHLIENIYELHIKAQKLKGEISKRDT